MPDRLTALVERLRMHADALDVGNTSGTDADLARLAVGDAPKAMRAAAAHLSTVAEVAREMREARIGGPETLSGWADRLTTTPGDTSEERSDG